MKILKNMSTFLLLLIASSLISLSFARKPAVEDFVGIEHETYQAQAKGTEVLFNFNNSMQQRSTSSSSTVFTIVFILAFISLPFVMWAGLTSSHKKTKKSKSVVRITNYKATTVSSTKETTTPSNVEYLSDYKKEEKKAS